MSFYRHCCTQMKFIPLDTLLLQPEYIDHLNQGTYPAGSILGACFTMNPDAQPSTPTTPIPPSNLYDTCTNTISQRTALVTDCDSNPNVQPSHATITNVTSTHYDTEDQPTQRIISSRNYTFTLPLIRTSMQSPITLGQSAEQPGNLLERSDLGH